MTNKPEHTALPWVSIKQSEEFLIAAKGADGGFAGVTGKDWSEAQENAAFIVRSCNSYYLLVEALDAVCNSVDEHGDICVTYDTLYKCCAALEKAKGE